jgi:hypothetical protein
MLLEVCQYIRLALSALCMACSRAGADGRRAPVTRALRTKFGEQGGDGAAGHKLQENVEVLLVPVRPLHE